MGGEQVKVNLGRLDQMIGELASFDKEIEQQIATLEGQVAALHTRWEGEAAAKHVEAQAEWTRGAKLLSDGIKGLHSASTEAHRSFQEAIAANKARFA
ncbi:WXG100 family type VII secretion target [Mycobacteroides abscessus]|uniref:ESAT-6-like protein n=1 Tax=Mycobacteroides abscessus subsp. massiliense TaxID=1962118 RepID=A0A1T8Y7V7_9MYCO|nr:WXG100 family type VII secretion target [Mycobacteroides abscessus]EHM20680.1 hypothetical protein MMAS_08770 [Mycobacteroides abscessus subsp. massiliense CCUG 48898 = JCM 15300]EIV67424.1 type VII secretion target protein [Mycobacteroides abscessus subsp. massiliense CCUG 48898 = JCM 15300]MBL3748582.1 WXG100 family type VII secretion target [Mycobacteroides abscessus subsp. massiliense]ORA86043.1 WXG100 family type VII secretion target [Mycobacteroides abscessus subsp. massiliense]SKE611